MSSPATSWARRCVDTASSYCSRHRALTIASRKLRLPSCAVCHAGRGSEPMIEVGNRTPAEALYIAPSLSSATAPLIARAKYHLIPADAGNGGRYERRRHAGRDDRRLPPGGGGAEAERG